MLGMDKKDKKVVTLNTIKNKLTRERLWQQIKHKKKLEKKERRAKKQEQRKEYGEEAVPIEVRFGVLPNDACRSPPRRKIIESTMIRSLRRMTMKCMPMKRMTSLSHISHTRLRPKS